MKKLLFLAVIAITTLSSCDKIIPGCWTCTDSLGNDLGDACGTSEQNAYDNSDIKAAGGSLSDFQRYCRKQ